MGRQQGVWSDLDWRYVLTGIGAGYVVLGGAWGVAQFLSGKSLVSIAIVVSIISGPGLVVLAGGYRLSRADIDPEYYSAIVTWTLAGIGVMLVILAVYHLQPDAALRNPGRHAFVFTAFSCAAGYGVGRYAARVKTTVRILDQKNQKLARTRADLKASNERLEHFACAASHDLKEPLRTISSYLHLIKERSSNDPDAEIRECIEHAVEGADRLHGMIDGLLEYSRVATTGEPFEPVSLNRVVDDVRKNLEVRVAETDAEIHVDKLPRVLGDERQLQQVFQNLLSNAIEYSGGDPPCIRVSATSQAREHLVMVRDEGVGIAADEVDRVFDLFTRLDSGEERRGTGIGLALCQRIVERHGGRIWVDSEPGEGTMVSFTLPAAHQGREPVV